MRCTFVVVLALLVAPLVVGCEDYKKDYQDAQAKISNLQSRISKLSKDNQKLNADNEQLKSKIADLEKEIDNLKTEIKRARNPAKFRYRKLYDRYKKLIETNNLKKLQRLDSDMKDYIAKFSDNDQYRSRIKGYREDIKKLISGVRQYNKSKKEINRLREDNEYSEALSVLNSDKDIYILVGKQKEYKKLRKEIAELKNKPIELDFTELLADYKDYLYKRVRLICISVSGRDLKEGRFDISERIGEYIEIYYKHLEDEEKYRSISDGDRVTVIGTVKMYSNTYDNFYIQADEINEC